MLEKYYIYRTIITYSQISTRLVIRQRNRENNVLTKQTRVRRNRLQTINVKRVVFFPSDVYASPTTRPSNRTDTVRSLESRARGALLKSVRPLSFFFFFFLVVVSFHVLVVPRVRRFAVHVPSLFVLASPRNVRPLSRGGAPEISTPIRGRAIFLYARPVPSSG